jgi:hypothetical protein
MSSNYHHLVHAELEGGLRQAGFSLELRPSGLGSVREFARWAKGVVGRTELAKFPMVIARPVPTRHG